jgi:hypothetical protein
MTNSKPSHKYMGTCLAWPWIVEFYCVVALAPGLLDFNRKLIFMILIQKLKQSGNEFSELPDQTSSYYVLSSQVRG